jgi:chaperonin GroES
MVTDLAVGDKVIFPKYTGTEIKMDGVDYLIMEDSDILARILE